MYSVNIKYRYLRNAPSTISRLYPGGMPTQNDSIAGNNKKRFNITKITGESL